MWAVGPYLHISAQFAIFPPILAKFKLLTSGLLRFFVPSALFFEFKPDCLIKNRYESFVDNKIKTKRETEKRVDWRKKLRMNCADKS